MEPRSPGGNTRFLLGRQGGLCARAATRGGDPGIWGRTKAFFWTAGAPVARREWDSGMCVSGHGRWLGTEARQEFILFGDFFWSLVPFRLGSFRGEMMGCVLGGRCRGVRRRLEGLVLRTERCIPLVPTPIFTVAAPLPALPPIPGRARELDGEMEGCDIPGVR